MIKLPTLLIFVTYLTVISCNVTKPKSTRKNIDLSSVQSITIGKSKEDSTALTMTKSDVKTFVRKWNVAKSEGLCIYLPTHWIIVNLKDGTQRIFRQNGKSIKEKNDECFNMGDPEEYEGLYR